MSRPHLYWLGMNMDWILPKETIEDGLLQLERSILDPMTVCHAAMQYCGDILENYRAKVVKNDFTDEAVEIQFFKSDKPLVWGLLLYYGQRLKLALETPLLDTDLDRERIQTKIDRAHSFLARHHGMVLYLDTDGSDMDAQYFLRKNRKNISFPHYNLSNFDPHFSTSHDGLVAHILAHKEFQRHLLGLLGIPRQDLGDRKFPLLNWTGSKTDLMELVLGLYGKGAINNGHTTIKELVVQFQRMFGVDLGDHYHLAMRLRNRSHPTKFLDSLSETLLGRIDELEA